MYYLIVGTGPSIKEVNFNDFADIDNLVTIAVNASIVFLPRVDIWFSLDPSERNIRFAMAAQERKIPIVWALSKASDPDERLLKMKNTIIMERVSTVGTTIPPHAPRTPKEWFERWNCKPGLSESPSKIHTGNSLYGALNLAFLEKPSKIGILGLDGSQKKSIGGEHYPNNLSHLPLLFESAVEQLNNYSIEVMNASPKSTINCFPKCDPKKLSDWFTY